ncbi:MAG: L,D-transpeptidase family protein [Patescibacteria group bacterium]
MAKQQLLFAIAENESSITGQVSLYELTDGLWTKNLSPFACVFGKNGLTIDKREGDGKSPVGLFELGRAFTKRPHSVAWPTHVLTPNDFWVDDVEHPLYNQYVDLSQVQKTWQSDENLLRTDDQLYDIVIVVEYNTKPVVAGMGSAIFFHVWRASDKGTAGCTAVAPENAEAVLAWLDPEAHPRLVQGTMDQVREILQKEGLSVPSDLQ